MHTKEYFQKLTIAVVGGSIAGMAISIFLRELGAKVIVLERSSQPHVDRGVGVFLPEELIAECKQLKLFADDIRALPVHNRSFNIKDEKTSRKLWEQPLSKSAALNWGIIYENLHRRFHALGCHYHAGEEVIDTAETNHGCVLKTSKGKTHTVDYVIAADGIGSAIRKKIYPETKLKFASYVVWRGVVSDSSVVQEKIFDNCMPYFVFDQGHLLLYRIPAPTQDNPNRTILNWLFYVTCSPSELDRLLTDKNNVKHEVSLPPGSLGKYHLDCLHTLARKVLPTAICKIIIDTEQPFLQAIFDLSVPQYVKGRYCFMGDAAAILRPHSGSGVLKAIKDSIAFFRCFVNAIVNADNFDDLLEKWNVARLAHAQEQAQLAKKMGNGLVTNPPPWGKMNPVEISNWWSELIKGQAWYATKDSEDAKKPNANLLFKTQNPAAVNAVTGEEKIKIFSKL